MKLRIRNNTVRIRLTQPEVRSLRAGGRVEQVTHFSPDQRLIQAIIPSGSNQPKMTFTIGQLFLHLPQEMIKQWADTDQVGIELEQPAGPDQTLEILIEKDFACLHRESDDTPDTFPNPNHVA